ncbi:MAG: hypothetical protein QNJ41_23625 [Xenococcaceae cyanobacterium MO_188.B32]|nr:hypothetical protein [Xenococcaceae cyanobacterium MO_188.B32]
MQISASQFRKSQKYTLVCKICYEKAIACPKINKRDRSKEKDE